MKYRWFALFASLLGYLLIFLAVKYPPHCEGKENADEVRHYHRGERGRGRGREGSLEVLVRPQEQTVLAGPVPSPCRDQQVNLVVAVVSAPTNFMARSVIR